MLFSIFICYFTSVKFQFVRAVMTLKYSFSHGRHNRRG